jgi:hypothetical protein
MSHTEHVIGEVVKIKVPDGLTGERLIGWLIGQGYIRNTDPNYFEYDLGEDYPHGLEYIGSEDICMIDDTLWAITQRVDYEEHDSIARATVVNEEEGRYTFECRWYNGGASFQEILTDALDSVGAFD